jgi:hypothetical protein
MFLKTLAKKVGDAWPIDLPCEALRSVATRLCIPGHITAKARPVGCGVILAAFWGSGVLSCPRPRVAQRDSQNVF